MTKNGIPLLNIPHRCEKKHVYDKIEKAEKAALAAKNRTGEDIRPYKCNICRRLHIGHYKIQEEIILGSPMEVIYGYQVDR